MTDDPPTALSRRAFLRAAIGVGGALGAVPLLGAMPPLLGAMQSLPIRVGIIVPAAAPGHIAQGLLEGMALASSAIVPTRLRLARAELSSIDELATMIETNSVDALVGLLSRNHLDAITPLLARHQLPLLVTDIGANVQDVGREHPWVARLSLNHWQASYAAGRYAASQARRVLMLSTLYESGYDTLYAFRLGVERGGGQIVDTVVLHQLGQQDLVPAMSRIAAAAPDAVFAAGNGDASRQIAAAYASAGLAATPLLGSSFFEVGAAPLRIETVRTWDASVDTAANDAFRQAYAARYGGQPDSFAALGFDAAQLLGSAAHPAPDLFAAALGSAAFETPRGALAMHPATRDAASPQYLVRHGSPASMLPASLAAPHPDDLHALRTKLRTGWITPYLSI